MSHNLQVKIEAGFDRKELIAQLNKQIKTQIQPQINKIKLKVDIDERAVVSMRKIVDNLNVLKQAFKEQNKVISEHTKTIKLDGDVTQTVTKQHLKNGEVITKTKELVDKRTKAVKAHTKAVQVDQAELDKLGKKLKDTARLNAEMQQISSKEVYGTKNFNTTVSKDAKGAVTGYSTVANHAAEQKDLETQIKKREQLAHQLKLFQQMSQIKYDNLSRNTKLTAEQRAELDKLFKSIQSLTVNTPKLQQQMTQARTNIKQFTSDVNLARTGFVKFGDAVSHVTSKVAMWAGGMTLFYLPIRGLQQAVDLIYQVDAQMTQLARVMDDSTNFEGMLERSIELTKQLGQSITTVNESFIEFARMGFDEQQTVALGKTATLFQNISEVNAKEAVDAIVAAMIVWNVEAEKSITIVDKLNSIDNNFSVTSRELSVGMQKASATAKNFGVELNTLLGHLTSVMSTTRETGSVVGNSLRTIYSRITTMSEAETALNEIGISIRELSGDMRPVQDTLTDLHAIWHTLNNEQRQNIAYTVAGKHICPISW